MERSNISIFDTTTSGNYYNLGLLPSNKCLPQTTSQIYSPNLFRATTTIPYSPDFTFLEPFSIHGGVLNDDRSRAPTITLSYRYPCYIIDAHISFHSYFHSYLSYLLLAVFYPRFTPSSVHYIVYTLVYSVLSVAIYVLD